MNLPPFVVPIQQNAILKGIIKSLFPLDGEHIYNPVDIGSFVEILHGHNYYNHIRVTSTMVFPSIWLSQLLSPSIDLSLVTYHSLKLHTRPDSSPSAKSRCEKIATTSTEILILHSDDVHQLQQGTSWRNLSYILGDLLFTTDHWKIHLSRPTS